MLAITAIRTIIIYAVLIAAMRIMGRRQLGELQPIELVVTLLISDLASVPMQESGIPLLSGLVPIAVLVAAEILLSAWMLKSPRFSSLVSGNPLILVRDGKPDQTVLKKLRMSVEDLTESLRKQNVYDFRDIQLAIAETNGSISVYPIAAKRPTVYEDIAPMPPTDHGAMLVVVADGTPCDWAMQVCGVDKQWIDTVLKREQYTLDQVMILTANTAKDYYVVPKEVST